MYCGAPAHAIAATLRESPRVVPRLSRSHMLAACPDGRSAATSAVLRGEAAALDGGDPVILRGTPGPGGAGCGGCCCGGRCCGDCCWVVGETVRLTSSLKEPSGKLASLTNCHMCRISVTLSGFIKNASAPRRMHSCTSDICQDESHSSQRGNAAVEADSACRVCVRGSRRTGVCTEMATIADSSSTSSRISGSRS